MTFHFHRQNTHTHTHTHTQHCRHCNQKKKQPCSRHFLFSEFLTLCQAGIQMLLKIYLLVCVSPLVDCTKPFASWHIKTFWYLYFVDIKKVKWSHYRPGVAQRVGRGIALLFHDRGTRRGWVVSSTPRPHFTPGKDSVPILQEAGWAPGPVWTGGKSRPHRDSIPDRPARSQSLYRLSYPDPYFV